MGPPDGPTVDHSLPKTCPRFQPAFRTLRHTVQAQHDASHLLSRPLSVTFGAWPLPLQGPTYEPCPCTVWPKGYKYSAEAGLLFCRSSEPDCIPWIHV
jgi:hypothetical protein